MEEKVMILTSLGARFWSSFLPLRVFAVLNSDIGAKQCVLLPTKREESKDLLIMLFEDFA
jgi:hypothetical protein